LAEEAAAAIRERTQVEPEFAVILGSGLAAVCDAFDADVELSFEGIPGLPPPSVPGHPARFVAGTVDGVRIGEDSAPRLSRLLSRLARDLGGRP
jgi:purine-nucleoside phosphorylase